MLEPTAPAFGESCDGIGATFSQIKSSFSEVGAVGSEMAPLRHPSLSLRDVSPQGFFCQRLPPPDIGEICGEVGSNISEICVRPGGVATMKAQLRPRSDVSPQGEMGKQKPVVEVTICGLELGEWNAVFQQNLSEISSKTNVLTKRISKIAENAINIYSASAKSGRSDAIIEPTAPAFGESCGGIGSNISEICIRPGGVATMKAQLRPRSDVSPQGFFCQRLPPPDIGESCGEVGSNISEICHKNAVFPQIFRKFASDQVA